MAANTKRNKGRGDSILQQEDILQAVVLADSFNVRFAPITAERPRALFPLVNCPLLDYTLEFLASAGIQEIFVFCCSHADQLKNHIQASKWSQPNSPCIVKPIASEGCHSVGDALREVERKSMIRSHFVLVSGDLLSNMLLKDLIEQHKARFKTDKSAVITLVFKQAFPGHRTRSVEDDIVVGTDSTHRILSYQKMRGRTKARFPLNLFEENKELSLRYDLMHSHISICSPRVTELFVDNFDYQNMSDLIRGTLINEEIEGNKLYMHVIEEEYAARVTDLPMYDSISKDVIRRWVHPLVPDTLTSEGEGYKLGRHNVYLASNVTLERGSVLQEDVIVGQGTSIGTNTVISQSVIGKNCAIGENVILDNTYVWDNVRIESNCKLSMAILCDRVCLRDSVVVQPGCVLSFGVKVGPGITLPPGTLLTTAPPAHDESDQEDMAEDGAAGHATRQQRKVPVDRDVVGEEGEGYEWRPALDEEEDDGLRQQLLGLNISVEEGKESSSSEGSGDEEQDEFVSISPPPDDTKLFYNEVVDSMQRTLEENIKLENLILEINSSKYAYNVSMRELVQLVVKAVLEMPHLKSAEPLPAAQLVPRLTKLVNKLLPVLQNYIKNAESQLDCLNSLEDYCLTSKATTAALPKLLLQFYEADVLSEEAILHWYSNTPSSDDAVASASRKQIRTQVQPFIKWLQEAEEESDSSEED
ncbi:translation initiation factor eIF-2B subunit epsilon-like [Acanthaster planci]|uniref:Translation initiation factor eIF2B subunit epsilon n=1 Tax=Acanthaster planci TaxID=133434 RepID=A0A8B7ZTK3_ACAPL|nr:translation initiation factor eIF-2B subunit epsilon-like [Acanthaster planci]